MKKNFFKKAIIFPASAMTAVFSSLISSNCFNNSDKPYIDQAEKPQFKRYFKNDQANSEENRGLLDHYQYLKNNFYPKLASDNQNEISSPITLGENAQIKNQEAFKEIAENIFSYILSENNFSYFEYGRKQEESLLKTFEIESKDFDFKNNIFFKTEGKLHEILKALNSLAHDALSQIQEKTIDFQDLINGKNQNSISYLYENIISQNKTISNSEYQNFLKGEWSSLGGIFINLRESEWNKKIDLNKIYEGKTNHNHSHAIINIINELLLFIKELQNGESKFQDELEEEIENLADKDKFKSTKTYKYLIHLLKVNLEKAQSFTLDAKKYFSKWIINTFENIARYKNIDPSNIITDVPLANGE